MATKRSGLGRGLESLIPTTAEDGQQPGFEMVPVDLIEANPDQPRTRFSDDAPRGTGQLNEGGWRPSTGGCFPD